MSAAGPRFRLLQSVAAHYGLQFSPMAGGLMSRMKLPATGQIEFAGGSLLPGVSATATRAASDKAANAEALALEGVPHIGHTLVSHRQDWRAYNQPHRAFKPQPQGTGSSEGSAVWDRCARELASAKAGVRTPRQRYPPWTLLSSLNGSGACFRSHRPAISIRLVCKQSRAWMALSL